MNPVIYKAKFTVNLNFYYTLIISQLLVKQYLFKQQTGFPVEFPSCLPQRLRRLC